MKMFFCHENAIFSTMFIHYRDEDYRLKKIIIAYPHEITHGIGEIQINW
jgi:hypothetical protein